jgi:hypothetical protein
MRLGFAAAFFALAVPVAAQIGSQSYSTDYDLLYGPIVDVTIEDLVFGVGNYDGRGVRTKGRLELLSLQSYRLSEAASSVAIVPVNEIASTFDTEAPRWVGREVEVVGVVSGSGAGAGQGSAGFTITFWRFDGPPEPKKGPLKSNAQTLEALVVNPGHHDGETVKVVGQFRGRNLYGDLPSKSLRNSSDWVIKDDLFAVWITGKKPKGPGWELDSGMKRDTGKWVEVVGRVETRDNVTYVRALEVRLTSPPTPTAEAKAPPPPPDRPKLPPVVVFALPLDGDREIPADSRFIVQFSKDMDPSTFKGRVVLRYVGPVLPGDRAFDGVKMNYDEGRRALTVDPGDLLRPGRKIELILLPGIADLDGLTLVPRAEPPIAGVADVFLYQVLT